MGKFYGRISIQLAPIEFLDKISALIPPPRRHRHHYHGAFAPNAPLRPAITKAAIETPVKILPTPVKETAQKTSFTWAKLRARTYEVNPLLCPCGKEMKMAIKWGSSELYAASSSFCSSSRPTTNAINFSFIDSVPLA